MKYIQNKEQLRLVPVNLHWFVMVDPSIVGAGQNPGVPRVYKYEFVLYNLHKS